MKSFRLSADDIEAIAEGYGACFATDMITVDGRKVAFMYREAPDNEVDSGWRFMSGFESDDYMSDPENVGIYDVNTIANYDRGIVSFLEAPIGSAFERRDGTGDFEQVDFDAQD